MRNLWINGFYAVANVMLLFALATPLWAAGQGVEAQAVEQVRRGRTGGGGQSQLEFSPMPERGEVAAVDQWPEEPAPGPEQAREYQRLPSGEKVVALTFDDGPGPRTRALLDILSQRDVPATFFVLGDSVLNHPGHARAIAQAGHDLANHTWSHPRLTELSRERVWWEVAACAAAIEAVGGQARPYLRPPYGSRDEQLLDVAEELGYVLVMWDVDSRDWELTDADQVLERALARVRPGSIVLFHDRPKVTLKVLPRFIDALQAQGYRFVLLSQYFQ